MHPVLGALKLCELPSIIAFKVFAVCVIDQAALIMYRVVGFL